MLRALQSCLFVVSWVFTFSAFLKFYFNVFLKTFFVSMASEKDAVEIIGAMWPPNDPDLNSINYSPCIPGLDVRTNACTYIYMHSTRNRTPAFHAASNDRSVKKRSQNSPLSSSVQFR